MAYNTRSFENLIKETPTAIERIDNGDLSYKPDSNKWSKKEIMGHLVDSAFYNLRRFTEVLFEDKPYKIIPYNQDELVKVNSYQDLDIEDITHLWTTYNSQIVFIVKKMTEAELGLFVQLDDESYKTVEWLIEDYVDHLNHHLKQIFSS